jgi:hypothetical protein
MQQMRSILTMLGIVIGVGAVIAVIGIGRDAAAKAQERWRQWSQTCCSPVPAR